MFPRFGLALVLVAAVPVTTWAQPNASRRPVPRIGYVFPGGGQVGTTFTLTIGGNGLGDDAHILITGGGIEARITGYHRPLNQKEVNALQEEATALKEKRTAGTLTPAELQRGKEIREKMRDRPNRTASQALVEMVTFECTIAADAPLGPRELRLKTPDGTSNPMGFMIGELPEFSESTARPAPPPRREQDARTREPATEMAVTLPATLNGRILPGETDRFTFSAARGQRLVVAAQARQLIPYLADAVPGWFQATIALLGPDGAEVAYDDDFRFSPDPVLAYDVPADGVYTLEVKDAIFRGREDFVYRIALGEIPFITSINPLGGTIGASTDVVLHGWNLAATAFAVSGAEQQPGRFLLSVRSGPWHTNLVPFVFDAVTAVPEATGDHHAIATAQPLPAALPFVVNGGIDSARDRDVYRLDGSAGQPVIAEVFARRLNAPLDSQLLITDADGKPLAANDDTVDPGAGLTTHHADSLVQFTVPADGRCFIHVSDAQHTGSDAHAYRLHVRSPEPDFELRVTPATINLHAGTSTTVTVHALRRDGFAGPITLSLRDPSGSLAVNGGCIPAGEDKLRFTLTAPPTARAATFNLHLEGHAMIGDRHLVHDAIPAEDMMQAFLYRHLVPAHEWKVDLLPPARQRAAIGLQVKTPTPHKLASGGANHLRVQVPAAAFLESVDVELSEPPAGISLAATHRHGTTLDLEFACDSTVTPGLAGNLILTATGTRTPDPAKNDAPRPASTRRFPLGTFPAIPFEVVAP